MADSTYNHIKELAKIVKYNIGLGFNEIANEELQKLHRSINELLEPELEELSNKIDKSGIEEVLQEHPNLLSIIENYDQIQKEIIEWKSIKV